MILMAAARDFVDRLLAAAAKAKLDVIGMNVEPKALSIASHDLPPQDRRRRL